MPARSAEPPVGGGYNIARAGHEASDGFRLSASKAESVHPGPRCRGGARVRRYDIAAIDVEMTLNRYLDHDPRARMYVLEEDLDRVRREEAQNRRARSGHGDPAVSLGLAGDAIQPLTLRVDQGECLRVRLRNAMAGREPASFHLHGAGLVVGGSSSPAVATNPKAVVRPGGSVTYEWMVDEGEPEGTHYFHSHGNDRYQSGHGLFGAVIVEPKGSRWLDPRTGRPLRTGWAAVIQPPTGPAFREFALYYHEVGDESYQIRDRSGRLVPIVDPLAGAYRPGTRALNYRSEPFMNRLRLQKKLTGRFDESVSYSSYTFGDPATPIMRAYLGDPVKQRVIHAGSEVFHVHHVHGGAIRWRRQPGTEDTAFAAGLVKHPPLLPKVSERIDSQALGPSETYDLEDECGSGGCQQSVGDYLFHCHVAHHYFAGMWGIWRVYNTRQDAAAPTDDLGPLRELPDRRGRVRRAVTSKELAGNKVDWFGRTQRISDVGAWVERQLPPAGKPTTFDASVLDWRRRGDLALGEPETGRRWPGYRSRAPGRRPPILFDPASGKPAYPFLRPHLGHRPPFAPNHGPAPFLDPLADGQGPGAPGASGPGSVCPAGTTVRTFRINAITLPVPLNRKADLVDPEGEIYVLADQEAAIRADPKKAQPLAIRANAGQDCLDVVFASELADSEMNHAFAKANVHIHFVQFDVQASDGVITGFNYEQSVRPFTVEGTRLSSGAPSGADTIRVLDARRFHVGAQIGVGMDRADRLEVARIASVDGDTLRLASPLRSAHRPGEFVSTEFVRYRWYPDVQFGTAYFHDHVNAINSWGHGLFGALISEPPGSTYHDPHTGAEISSGPLADVHTTHRVSADIAGSFRELAMFIQDNVPIDQVGRSSGSALNMRAEPLDSRAGPPSRLFLSAEHGDPETPIIESYLGDPVVVRLLVGATNDVHTWHIDGHWFRAEPFARASPPTGTVHVGISERYDLSIPHAGGPQRRPGDYLYQNGRSFKTHEGSWGLLRVYGPDDRGGPERLPGHDEIPRPSSSLCPSSAPRKNFDVSAVYADLPMLGGRGRIFALAKDAAGIEAGRRPAEPLVLHVGVGDCIAVRLSDRTKEPVSLHADMLAFDPEQAEPVGRNAASAVAPGAARTYTFFASPEVGETTALLRDIADPLQGSGEGLYGAIVVGPAGASFRDPITGRDASRASSWKVDVIPRRGRSYRDFSIFFQDDDESIGTHRMPYSAKVGGTLGLNYNSAPLTDRLDQNPDTSAVFSSAVHGDPPTPLMEAYAGDRVRVHVLAPWSEQAHVFTIEGHRWPMTPGLPGTDLLEAVQVGALEADTLDLDGGAGGPAAIAGDYLYGDHREPYREAGLWGIFRVRCPGRSGSALRALPGSSTAPAGCDASRTPARSGLVAGLALVAVAILWRRRRRTGPSARG